MLSPTPVCITNNNSQVNLIGNRGKFEGNLDRPKAIMLLELPNSNMVLNNTLHCLYFVLQLCSVVSHYVSIMLLGNYILISLLKHQLKCIFEWIFQHVVTVLLEYLNL